MDQTKGEIYGLTVVENGQKTTNSGYRLRETDQEDSSYNRSMLSCCLHPWRTLESARKLQ